MKLMWVLGALAAFILSSAAIGRAEEALSTELLPLSRLLGEWSGSGSITDRSGERQHFDSQERAEARIEGNAILIEGVHRATNGPAKGEITHHALALVTWDAEERHFRFDSFVKGRGRSDFSGRIEGERFIWGREEGEGRRFRFVIDLSRDGVWNEVGEFSMDGTSWTPFFEMNLEKQR